MKIIEGKFYRTRNGLRVGPAVRHEESGYYNWSVQGNWYTDDGFYIGPDEQNPLDLVAEWTDESTGPVRVITRKQIVPGTYGAVRVYGGPEGSARLYIGHDQFREAVTLSADELRAAAATLNEIADALSEPPHA